MIIPIGVFLIALAMTIPLIKYDEFKKDIKYSLLITMGILFLFLAFRYNYGNDYVSYYHMFVDIKLNPDSIFNNTGEIVFKFLMYIVPNFALFVALTSLFYIIVIYHLIKNNVFPKVYVIAISVLLLNPYLFLVQLSAIRQTVAICIFILSIPLIRKGKFISYIFTILFASHFHISALVLLPVYLIRYIKKIDIFKNKLTLKIVIVLVALIFTLSPLVNLIMDIIIQFFPKYGYYLLTNTENSLRSTILNFVLFLMILFGIDVLDEKHKIFGHLSLIAMFLYLLSYKISMMTRIAMYFEIFHIIALPMIAYKMKNRDMKIIFVCYVILLYVLRLYSFYTNPIWHESYKTYQMIFENMFN